MPDITHKLPPEAADFLSQYPDTAAVDAILADLSGVVRGKRYPIAELGKVLQSGFAIPGSVFMLDTQGESHDPDGIGFSDGDPDYLVKVIPGSLKPVPWAQRPLAQVMVTLEQADGTPYYYEPRNVLRRTVEKLNGLGLRPVVAFELEFYLIDRDRLPGGAPQPPISPATGRRDEGTQVYGMKTLDAFAEILDDMTRACAIQDVPTGAVTAEYAAGQFEINLEHVDDPLQAADDCVLFKRIIQGVAQKHGLQATFMAKPYLERAGSGMHMHVSLLDKTGGNVFDGGAAIASDTLRHAIGGVLEVLPESMTFLAPNVNSYRRFLPDIFVPTQRSWGFENRSVALRIPAGGGDARRIEHRIAGADANPYLALATLLAGIHKGIAEKTDPGPPWDGNASETYDETLPFRPRRAIERLTETCGLADYFGADYLRAYAACKEKELDRFESQISPLEYNWFLQAD
ncbi:glutamine synthetase [Pelagibius litoralis]|uniref:Glutamine synthetase n=1 Tax=Pelagibius litoralis TaxID=374515 RepID=A0A967C4W9_9PROT|nr:glutamine synthetase family protein [Pelagibius litoralis]NIA68754.1 glutamine synthetase [Pelagibius litoralis]